MRGILARATLVLASASVLAGCGDLTGIFHGRPPTLVERHGLSYQVIVSPSRYYYDVYEYRIRVTNTSHHTVERWLPAHMARPRVYHEDHWGRPVWDPCHWGCDWWGRRDDVWIRLRPGQAVEGWWGDVWTEDFVGSRHYGGVYHLTLIIDTGRHRFEVLGLPEIWVR